MLCTTTGNGGFRMKLLALDADDDEPTAEPSAAAPQSVACSSPCFCLSGERWSRDRPLQTLATRRRGVVTQCAQLAAARWCVRVRGGVELEAGAGSTVPRCQAAAGPLLLSGCSATSPSRTQRREDQRREEPSQGARAAAHIHTDTAHAHQHM